MKWLKRLLITGTVLLVVLIAVPFFIPFSTYIPEIEKLASEKLHMPVTVQSLHIWLIPAPRAALSEVTVGRARNIKINKISIEPELSSLFEPVKVVKYVNIETLTLNQEALNKIPAWIADTSPSGQTVRIKQVWVRNLRLVLNKQTIGPFNADADINSNNNLEKAVITSPDETLKITIKPEKGVYLLSVAARKWQPQIPQSLQTVLIDELDILGRATLQELDLPQINAKLYGGNVTGKMNVNWKNDWMANGELHTKDMEINSLVKMFSKTSLSGKLTADAMFDSNGKSAEQLIDNPNLNMTFSIANGVLNKVDLAQAAKLISKEGSSGGQTRFDELSGNLHIADKHYRLRNIKMSSGMLGADGNVDISPNQELSGTVSVKVKSGINLVSMPLAVSGTVNDPVLRPTAGAMAGAAAGTVLLGPVLGTSLGIKAGEFTQNLFGKKDEKPEKQEKQDK